jgi:hypothetical protein
LRGTTPDLHIVILSLLGYREVALSLGADE